MVLLLILLWESRGLEDSRRILKLHIRVKYVVKRAIRICPCSKLVQFDP